MSSDNLMDKYVARSPEAAWRVIEGEALIITPRESTLHSLNPVGTSIWEHADGRTRVSEIVDAITEEFDVDRARAEEDVKEFLQQLLEQGIIKISDEPGPVE